MITSAARDAATAMYICTNHVFFVMIMQMGVTSAVSHDIAKGNNMLVASYLQPDASGMAESLLHMEMLLCAGLCRSCVSF